MNSSHVYVITPTYNRTDLLFRMLRSLERQTYTDAITVLICHDGANRELRQQLASYTSRLSIVYDEIEHEGLVGGRPRKHLIDNHLPDDGYVVFIDDDNVVYPNYIQRMLNAVQGKELAFCQIEHVQFNRIIPMQEHLGRIVFEDIDSLNVIMSTRRAKMFSNLWIQNPEEPINHDYKFIRACSENVASDKIGTVDVVLGIHSADNNRWNLFNKMYDTYPFLFTEICDWNVYRLTQKDIKDSTVIDIGANIGMFVYHVEQYAPKRVIAIEPQIDNYKQLNALRVFSNVELLNAAVVGEESKDKFYFINADGVKSKVSQIPEEGSVPVLEKITLSDIIARCPTKSNVLKIDCEGGEYDILLNATTNQLLYFSAIVVEAHPPAYTNLPHTYESIAQKVTSAGFKHDFTGFLFAENTPHEKRNVVLVFRRLLELENKTEEVDVTVPPLEDRFKVTAYVCTRNRYNTTLPIAVNSMIHQSFRPTEIIIYDDTPKEERQDLREQSLFKHMFVLCSRWGIDCSVVFGDGQGQVRGHNYVKEHAKGNLLWRMDDDCFADSTVLQKLVESFDDKTGAVAPCIMDAVAFDTFLGPIPTGKLVNMNREPNLQWFEYPWDTQFEAEHLYSSFVYRKELPVSFDNRLSFVGHREETLFTHNVFRAGWKLKVRTGAIMWHYRETSGGIRATSFKSYWDHDEEIFQSELKRWGVSFLDETVVHLDCGVGDHYAFLSALPAIQKKHPNLVISCCYPNVLRNVKNARLLSVDEGKRYFGDALCDSMNIYKFMYENNWSGNLVDAFQAAYTWQRDKHDSSKPHKICPSLQNATKKQVVIAPYSRELRNGMPNPKNFPHFEKLTGYLRAKGLYIIQVGDVNDVPLSNVDEYRLGEAFEETEKLLADSLFFVCVDNFLHHMGYYIGRRGVVLWGQSDPNLFGYAYHLNILKSRNFLRPNQFDTWENATYNVNVFPTAEEVRDAIFHEFAL